MSTMGERAELALRMVREAPKIAYDTETTGLDWRVNQPVGYVITESAQNNVYVPVRHGGGGNLGDPHCGPMTAPDSPTVQHAFERELAKAFEERRRRKYLTIGHHLKFDMHFSAKQGIFLGRECEDTQINEPMLDEYARSFGLASCAIRRGVTAKKGEQLYAYLADLFGGKPDHTSMANFWRLAGNDELGVDYATGDGITTLELREVQYPLIIEEGMEYIHSVESRLIWTLFRMERRGIKTDMAYIDQLTDAVATELVRATAALPPRFNVRSGPQVRALMEEAGHTDWPLTLPSTKFPEGQPSFTESFLKKSPEGRSIIAVRQLTNLMNTFVRPLAAEHIYEGRVHAQANQLKADDFGTVSGRLSYSNPNLQAIHKRNKELGRRFRTIFVADEGMEFYEGDYKQCEPVLFTHYSQEPALVAGYSAEPPMDMHHVVAGMLDVERDPTAKRMNMGILTGMQAATFAGHMGWDLDYATEMHTRWFEGFPGIKQFQDDAKQLFRKRGWVKTILGRRCRLDDQRYAYRGVSRIIQGSNADIVKERLLRIDEYLEETGDIAHMLMTVHDSFEWQAPAGPEGEAISAEIVRISKNLRGEPFNLRVPMGMDVGKGLNWAEATYGPAQ